MYCPSCKAEFIAGIEVCNSCGTPLVAALPAPPQPPPLSVVAVANYADPASAQLAAEYVRSNGIEVLLTNEHTLGLNWLYSTGLGGVSLVVSQDQATEARALLASMSSAPSAADEPPEFAGGRVDQATLEHSRRVNSYKALFTLLVTIPPIFLAGLALHLARQGQEQPSTDREGADLTPRCSGQHRRVRACVAAELIRR